LCGDRQAAEDARSIVHGGCGDGVVGDRGCERMRRVGTAARRRAPHRDAVAVRTDRHRRPAFDELRGRPLRRRVEPPSVDETLLRVPHGVDRGRLAREHRPAEHTCVGDAGPVEGLLQLLPIRRVRKGHGMPPRGVEHGNLGVPAAARDRPRACEQCLESPPFRQ